MCTLLAAVQVWPERPLVIAGNRDEALGRPATEPRVWAAGEVAERRVLAPRDLQAGGTWLGLNDLGLFVGITNRRAVPDPRRRSRGELVFTALGAEDVADARARITRLAARDYNPFHLLCADRLGAAVIWSDGEQLHERTLAPGIHWITERSFGAAPSQRHATLDGWAARLAAGPAPELATWQALLAEHRTGTTAPPSADAIELDGVCVHAQPLAYGTRSSSLIELPAAVAEPPRFFHAIGRPCEVPLRAVADAGKLCVSATST
jgi:uncharacterized protein with NRDE domain